MRRRIERAVQEDKELLVDPCFFVALKERSEDIGAVEILLKRGFSNNELTHYRYDVILHVGAVPSTDAESFEWSLEQGPLSELRSILKTYRPPLVRIKGVRNHRVARNAAFIDLIEAGNPHRPVEDLQSQLEALALDGEDPETFWALGEAERYEIRVSWSPGPGDRFDVVMIDRSQVVGEPNLERPEQALRRPLAAYASNPEALHIQSRLVTKLRAHLQASLPDYMIPQAFVLLDRLPLTPNGKVDRIGLPAPEGRRQGLGYVAPRTPVEAALADIWAQVLGLDRVGAEDNFFDLGGHSLLATRMVSLVREHLGIEFPLRVLFEVPTVKDLAQKLEALQREGAGLSLPPLDPQPRPACLPLSYAQERLWFLDQMGLVGSAYLVPMPLRLEGALDATALELSLTELVRRHESLRTRFEMVNGEPVQMIDPAKPLRLGLIDLSRLNVVEQEAEVQRLTWEDMELSFDLTRSQLLRSSLLKLSEETHILLMTMHHIVSDGWSVGVLRQELGALYAAHLQGRPSPLPEPKLQYGDYTLWQRSWLRDEVIERQLTYWREQLSGVPAALELPTDRPRPAIASFKGATVPVVLSPVLSDDLSRLARSRGVTLYMVLLAGFQAVLGRWSGQHDVVVGSAIAGRTERRLEDLVGFFANMLAMRTDLSGNPTFLQLLERVRETALDAYAHQDLPFEKLVAELQPERDLSRQPVVQVTFTLQNTPWQELRLPGLTLSTAESPWVSAKFDLFLSLWESPTGLHGYFEYATDLFEHSTIERLALHLQRLLEQVAADPGRKLAEIDLLSLEDRQQLLVDWNDRTVAYAKDRCIHELFVNRHGILTP